MSMADLVFFNVNDGYSEALLRGFRKSTLGEQQYTALRNTTNLKDFKSVLIDTDYSDYVKDYNETDTSALKMLLKKKLADEIDQVQSVAGPELDKFIEMIRHKYMIDNVIIDLSQFMLNNIKCVKSNRLTQKIIKHLLLPLINHQESEHQ